jgi:5-methylcytosine-specific restriction endonuclease McrA
VTCPHRQAAIAAGARRYFTGRACSNGHVAERTVKGGCVECSKVREQRRVRDPEKMRQAAARRYAANREEELVRRAKRRAEDRERRALAKEARDPEKDREKARQAAVAAAKRYRERNPDKVAAYHAAYSKANADKMRAKNHKQRARRLSAEGRFTAGDVSRIAKAQGGKCACCRNRRKLTVDHIVPLVKGGSNWPSNLQMLCKPCNSSKNARDPISFMQERGMLL